MKAINEEILQTLNLMQDDICDGAHSELQGHLYSLLEIKRNELQKRLATDTPLTAEELKAGGWWCADVSKECANAFKSKGLNVFNAQGWGDEGLWKCCTVDVEVGAITRSFTDDIESKKQIYRIGNEFYWSEK